MTVIDIRTEVVLGIAHHARIESLPLTEVTGLFGDLRLLLLTVSTVFIGLMAGLFFAFSVSVVLALETLSASAHTRVMQSINDAILNAVFGVVFVGSIIIPVVTTAIVLVRGDWTAQYGQLVIAGTVIYLVGTAAETMVIHVPMNEEIETWSPASPSDDWAAVRARWRQWNHVRTTAAVISFVVYLATFVALGTSGAVSH